MRNAIRYRRFLALICAMILAALTVAGCGKQNPNRQARESCEPEGKL